MFDTSQIQDSVLTAVNVVNSIRIAHQQLKTASDLLTRYTAGTDSVFVAAVDQIYTLQERQEIAATMVEIQAFILDMETNHSELLGIVEAA